MQIQYYLTENSGFDVGLNTYLDISDEGNSHYGVPMTEVREAIIAAIDTVYTGYRDDLIGAHPALTLTRVVVCTGNTSTVL